MLKSAQESYASLASSYLPNDEEKKELKQFCELHVNIKTLKEEIRNNTKSILIDNKTKKQLLKDYFKQKQLEILKLKDNKYIRLNKITKNNPITFETLRDAFNAINEEKLNEVEVEDDPYGIDGFIQSIVSELKLMSKSFNEQIVITSSLPRGKKGDTIDKAENEIEGLADIVIENSCQLREIRAKVRESLKEKTLNFENMKSNIDTYLQKANVSNQQISFNDMPFTLAKRVTISKPKMNLNVIEEYLQECCKTFNDNKKRPRKENAKAFWLKNKKDILQILEEKLLQIPQEQKSNIYLKRLSSNAMDAVEEECEDEPEGDMDEED